MIRPAASLLAVSLLSAPVLEAQFPPLTVPRGRVALELAPRFDTWSRRFRDGTSEPVAADYSPSVVGAGFFPALSDAEARLARVTGQADAILTVGAHSATQLVTVGELGVGLRIGLTSRLTLFGTLPFRRVRVQTTTRFDSTGAGAGFNPADATFGAPGGPTAMLAFFTAFDQAITDLDEAIATGTWAGDPATQAVAAAALAEARSLRDDLFTVMQDPATRSPFLPLASSPAGAALSGRIAALQQQLSGSLGIGGFAAPPPLPTSRLDAGDFTGFLTNPAGPVAGSVSAPVVSTLGDMEVGLAYLLVDRGADSSRATSLRAALHATVRLPSGQLDNPDRFYDLGTGERQPDVEGGMVVDAARGRAALRVAGWYALQLPGNQLRRLGPPHQPIQFANTRAGVRRNPGEVLGVGVFPAYRFTPRFALLAGVEWWTRGEDRYEYAEGQVPVAGAGPESLGLESAASALTVRAGVTWSHPGTHRSGRASAPLDAGLTWERVVAASGGRVPQAESVRALLRVYGRFW